MQSANSNMQIKKCKMQIKKWLSHAKALYFSTLLHYYWYWKYWSKKRLSIGKRPILGCFSFYIGSWSATDVKQNRPVLPTGDVAGYSRDEFRYPCMSEGRGTAMWRKSVGRNIVWDGIWQHDRRCKKLRSVLPSGQKRYTRLRETKPTLLPKMGWGELAQPLTKRQMIIIYNLVFQQFNKKIK